MVRVVQLELREATGVDAPVEEYSPAGGEGFLQKGLIEPDGPHAARAVAHDDFEDREVPAATRAAQVDGEHLTLHRNLFAGHELTDRFPSRAVLVAKWKTQKEVEYRFNARGAEDGRERVVKAMDYSKYKDLKRRHKSLPAGGTRRASDA